jgi:hypothetical protein
MTDVGLLMRLSQVIEDHLNDLLEEDFPHYALSIQVDRHGPQEPSLKMTFLNEKTKMYRWVRIPLHEIFKNS